MLQTIRRIICRGRTDVCTSHSRAFSPKPPSEDDAAASICRNTRANLNTTRRHQGALTFKLLLVTLAATNTRAVSFTLVLSLIEPTLLVCAKAKLCEATEHGTRQPLYRVLTADSLW